MHSDTTAAQAPSVPKLTIGYQQLTPAIPTFRWHASSSSWAATTPSSITAHSSKRISFLTFNVWFATKAWTARANQLLQIISANSPDIICFQEATPRFLNHVLNSEFIRSHYFTSDHNGHSVIPYGTMMLSKIPFAALTRLSLPSNQGRSLLLGEFIVNEKKIRVGTVHLESLKPNASRRAEQLHIIFDALKSRHSDFDATLIMGDFNFCSDWLSENANIDNTFTDVWPHLRPKEKGYTEDTDVNRMLASERPGETKQVRFDRVIIRSESWKPRSIELMGNKPIDNETEIFVSDHFGLLCHIEHS